jgi:hypothetical protein
MDEEVSERTFYRSKRALLLPPTHDARAGPQIRGIGVCCEEMHALSGEEGRRGARGRVGTVGVRRSKGGDKPRRSRVADLRLSWA